MKGGGRWLRGVLLVAVAVAGACADDRPAIDETTAALSVCDEVVPFDRFVDGIPAYAQCPGFENAAIYSNNGVDTSTTSLGADWIRTQGGGGYQCTELAHRYLMFRWNINWLPSGNAGSWCDTPPAAASGVAQTTAPVHGDLIVFAPGVCGAAPNTGHVAVVDAVDDAAAAVTVVEENQAGRRTAAESCATCYLHVVANDGSPGAGDGGSPISGGAAGSGGGAGGSPDSDAGSTAARATRAARDPGNSSRGTSGGAIAACGIGAGRPRAQVGGGLLLATAILLARRRRTADQAG
jgi:surface antigen